MPIIEVKPGNAGSIVMNYVGWCPQGDARARTTEVQPEDAAVVPSGSGSFKVRAIHWLGLFRNQTMLQTIGTFCMGFYLFTYLGGVSHLDLFVTGILAGVPFSAIAGFLYWRIFNEVLHDGPVVLWNRFDKASGIFAFAAAVIMIYGQVYSLTGLIPWFDAAMTNAFFGGFVAVLFWGMSFSVWKWESCTHRQLHYDGMILKLEKVEKNASL
jgi:hypothetical protein